MSQVQGMPGKLKVSNNYTNKAIFTHNDEQLEDNSKLCFEAIIAQTEKEETEQIKFSKPCFSRAIQVSHLPPVRDEGGSGDDEADDISDHDDGDNKVEVKKLWGHEK